MVLMPFSRYCKVKLDNWDFDNENTATCLNASQASPRLSFNSWHIIKLLVPAGQTEMAIGLVHAMYQADPVLEKHSQPQLLQLLNLADRFEVPTAQAAVPRTLALLPLDTLQFDTALDLLDFRGGCVSDLSYAEVVHNAESKLLQKLGDLVVVWADDQKLTRLLQLPHAVFLRLLQHDGVRVNSESTVVASILEWWSQQTESHKTGHVEQLKQLMQQVRMQPAIKCNQVT